MFRSKRDVDRHVQEILRKLNNEKERNLRCYNIAKLYYQVGDYESARRYISSYLAVREDSASAHKLFAQILEALGQKEKAITEYKCSLELENSQTDIILKVCDLLGDGELSFDLGRVRYWCERASQLYPHHPAVFRLKERLLSSKGEESLHELEALIESEMSTRPSDVSLRIRLIKLYQEANRLKDAYDQVTEVERRGPFRENLDWYDCISDVFKSYEEEYPDICGWEFYMYYTSCQEKKAYLSLNENQPNPRRTVAECVQVLFSFDQILSKTSQQSPPPSERELFQEFLRHMRQQLCLHLGTVVLKRAKKDPGNWREACRMAVPLLLHALGPPPDAHSFIQTKAPESRRTMLLRWSREAAFRISQAGHVVLAMLHERRSQFMDKIAQYCSGNWRERVFQRIFNTRDHHQQISTSHFVNYAGFAEPPLEVPAPTELRPNDEISQLLYPNSLHHLVWLGLQKIGVNKKNTSSKLCRDFYCLVFESLQLSTKNLNSSGIETLCRLDIDAFLYATVLCVAAAREDQSTSGYLSNDCPAVLPACITQQLSTIAQDKWWNAAYTIYEKKVDGNLGELRQVLQHGIEAVRILGNHGLDVRLIVKLAHAFADRAAGMTCRGENASDIAAVEERAALYWTSALPLLERLQRNQSIRSPHTRLFDYQGKELTSAEINALIEEGKFFLACQLMKQDKHERALEAFEQLKSPYASFYCALIYKKLAEQQFQGQYGEMITSEMRSQHIILLTKARECLYLTLDRLKSPGVDRKHPLNAELGGHIEEIESQLNHMDTDFSRTDVLRNDMLEGFSIDTGSSENSADENGQIVTKYNGAIPNSSAQVSSRNRSVNRLSSTPYRNNSKYDTSEGAEIKRVEARPSPERLDAQIRQLVHNKDTILQTVTQHSKSMMESIKLIMDELKDCKKEIKENREELRGYNQELKCNKQMIEELKVQVQELRKDTRKSRKGQTKVSTGMAQVCDTEDDVYVFEEEDYPENVAVSTNPMSTYPPFQPYPGYQNYRHVPGLMGTPAVSYAPPPAETHPQLIPPPAQPMSGFFRGVETLIYPPGSVSYYSSQGALPFSEGQQLPDFRGHHPPAFSRPGTLSETQNTQTEVKVPLPSAPVNVVITSSDTLPTTVPITQPVLSVTIPPQHRLGGLPLVQNDSRTAPPQPAVSTTFSSAKPVPLTSIQTKTLPETQPQQPQGMSSSVEQHNVPHAFQISMPPQVQLPQASVLEKGASALSPVLPIATHSLLSSVPSPVYSAVVTEKSPVPKEGSPKSHRVSTGSNAEEENDVETEHDPCPDFEPVIPLPAEVHVMTGEEEETVLFESRAKLYRFVEKEWKERGVGNIKILHNQKTCKIRILMRREQVLKVCANHFISAETELVPMKDRAWIWVANDFADETVKFEKLCVRFKTPEEAQNFKDAFEKAKTIIKAGKGPDESDSSQSSRSGSSTKIVDSVTSSHDSASSVSSVIAKSVLPVDTSASAVPETKSVATGKIRVSGFTFGATPTFKVDATSTMGSTASSVSTVVTKPVLSENTFPSTVPEAKSTTTGKITVGGFTFAATPTFKADSTPTNKTNAVELSKSKATIDEAPKSSPFMSFSFSVPSKPLSSFPEISKTAPLQTETIVKGSSVNKDSNKDTSLTDVSNTIIPLADPSKPVVHGPDILKTAGAAAGKVPSILKPPVLKGTSNGTEPKVPMMSDLESKSTKLTDKKEVTDTPLMFSSNALTFADLAAKSETVKPAFTPDKNFQGFEGAGTTVFGRLLKSKPQESETSEDNVSGPPPDEFVPTAEFKPVIPLPELIKVKTGEEEELVVFEERCKLLRFDGENKEWKERGVGNMKLLHDPKTGRVRLLMRREQVLKVCCNHAVTSSIKLKSLSTSDRAWHWIAQDYSEGEMRCEMLAIKFKTVALAEKFKKAVEDTQSKMVNDRIPISNNRTKSKTKEDKADSSESMLAGMGNIQKPSSEENDAVKLKASGANEPKSLQDPQKSSLADFKPKAGTWECNSCYIRNEDIRDTCNVCSTPRMTPTSTSADNSVLSTDTTPTARPLSEIFKQKPGTWTCSDCYVANSETSNKCVACNKSKLTSDGKPIIESASQDKSTFKFGITEFGSTGSTPGFKLSQFPTTSASSLFAATTTVSSTFSTFSFGMPPVSNGKKEGGSSFTVGSVEETKSQPQDDVETLSDLELDTVSSETAPMIVPEVKSSLKFVFGNSQFGSRFQGAALSFGSKETATKDQTPAVGGMLDHTFTFGSPDKFEFSFKGVSPKSPVKSPGTKHLSTGKEESGSEEEENVGEDDDGDIYFQPVIPLPEKVPLHTGEEDEDVIYCQRAKLFRFVSGEWKERAVGDVKLLRHKITKKTRILMRRDQVFKICLNHFLKPELIFKEKDTKSWQWSAPDFSEGQIQNELFAIRFKSPEIAAEFKSAIDNAQAESAVTPVSVGIEGEKTPERARIPQSSPEVENNIQGDEVSPAFKNFSFAMKSDITESPVPKFSFSSRFGDSGVKGSIQPVFGGTAKVSSEKTDDFPEVIYELKVTDQEKAEAEKLMLPPNFFAYRRQPSCPGCRGCKDDCSESDEDQQKLTTSSKLEEFNTSSLLTALNLTTEDSVVPVATVEEASNETVAIKTEATTNILQKPTFIFGGFSQQPAFGKSSTSNSSSWFSSANTFSTDKTNQSHLTDNARAVLPPTDKISKDAETSGSLHASLPYKTENVDNQSGNLFLLKDEKLPSHTSAPVFSLFSPLSDTNVGTSLPLQLNFGTSSKLESENNIVKTPGFGFTIPFQTQDILKSSSSEPEKKVEFNISGNKLPEMNTPAPFSSVSTGFSFSDLAAKAKENEPSSEVKGQFTFEGAGSSLFGNLKSRSIEKIPPPGESVEEQESSDDEAKGANSGSHDPHFEPIIPLPDAVEIHTGEEDEIVKYSERATLYRYDESVKQWKERGVGNIKILYHPINHTYRFLLRREQVHKVVCNHLITAEFSLKPFPKSSRAWLWAAHNFADNAGQLEKLAISFRKEEKSTGFYCKVMECIDDLKTRAVKAPEVTSTTETEKVSEDSYESGDNDCGDDDDDEDDDEEDEDDEYDYSDDECHVLSGIDNDSSYEYEAMDFRAKETTVFEKRATLSLKDGSQWTTLGLVDLKILQNKAKHKSKVVMFKVGHTEVLCEMIILENMGVQVRKKDCEWTGLDNNVEPAIQKTLCAMFSSEAAAQEFAKTFSECRDMDDKEDS